MMDGYNAIVVEMNVGKFPVGILISDIPDTVTTFTDSPELVFALRKITGFRWLYRGRVETFGVDRMATSWEEFVQELRLLEAKRRLGLIVPEREVVKK